MCDFNSADPTVWRHTAMLALVLLGASCRQADGPPGSEALAAGADAPPSSDEPARDEAMVVVEPIAVPDGTPEELFAFIDQLDEQLDVDLDGDELAGDADAAAQESASANISPEAREAIALRRLMEARIVATDKILARQVPEETRLRAITIQLDALRTLVALDPEGMAKRFDDYTLRIAKSQDPLLRRMALATRFQADVTRSLSADEPTAEQLIAQLEKLLDDPEAGPEIFNATVEAAGWLARSGDHATAAEAFGRIGHRFAEHPEPSLAEVAQSLINQSTNLELRDLAQGVIENRPQAIEKIMARMEQLLAAPEENPNRLAYAMQTAQLIEFTGHPREALQAYRRIADRFKDDVDAATAQAIRASVELAERRLNLIGQPLAIEGVHLSGKSLDWESYRGKWVLVCFWAAWHEQWPFESKNLRQALETYRDPPLSVVAISLDDDRNLLERFLKEHPAPWPVVVNADPTASGFENPNAVRCGVEAVPFIVLVDPQGIVVDIHLMGERLFSSLATHLGERP